MKLQCCMFKDEPFHSFELEMNENTCTNYLVAFLHEKELHLRLYFGNKI